MKADNGPQATPEETELERKLRNPDTIGDEGWGVALQDYEAAELADVVAAAGEVARWESGGGRSRIADLRDALARLESRETD